MVSARGLRREPHFSRIRRKLKTPHRVVLFTACASEGISIPKLTFPGQNPDRPLPSIVGPGSSILLTPTPSPPISQLPTYSNPTPTTQNSPSLSQMSSTATTTSPPNPSNGTQTSLATSRSWRHLTFTYTSLLIVVGALEFI